MNKLNIEWRVNLAKRCFKSWESEQDTSLEKHYIYVEEFFTSHIYSEIEDLRHKDSAYLGELMKQLLKLAEEEVEEATYRNVRQY